MNYSYVQNKILVITSMVSGTVSLISSSTLVVMILRSELKLGAPSRRIFFFLCIYDCIYSVASALSSIPVPRNDELWASYGNVKTCDFQGFIVHVGFLGSILYNCSLSIYYLCVIRFSMSEIRFRNTIEPLCHTISNIYPLCSAIYLLLGEYFNSIGQLCWVGPYPPTCIKDPNVVCQRGGKVNASKAFFWTLYIVFGIMTINMYLIVLKVVIQKRKSDRWGSGGIRRNSNSKPKSNAIASKCDADVCDLQNNTIEPQSCNAVNPSSLRHYALGNKAMPFRGKWRDKEFVKDEQPSRSEGGHPLAFELRAMREKTKGRSLIRYPAEATKVEQLPFTSNQAKNAKADPLIFNLRAMREKTRGKRLISSPQATENAKVERDHLAFDLRAMRAKTRAENLIRNPEYINSSSSSRKESTVEDAPLASNFREMIAKTRSDITFKQVPHDENYQEGYQNVRNDEPGIRKRSEITKTPGSKRASTRFSSLENAVAEASMHATLYILAFMLTWIFLLATRILHQRGRTIPFFLHELARVFNPLQGLFNILVYCRPHMISLRRNNSDYSWIKAFWLTIKGGGDNDSAGQSRQSALTRKKDRQRNQERIRQEHLERMQRIREKNELSDRGDLTFRQSDTTSPVLSSSLKSSTTICEKV